MISNYLKIAFRNLWKSKTYSFLNIFGLAIGVACAGLIFLWVEDEKSYDKMYSKHDNIFMLRTNQLYEGQYRTFNSTPGPLAAALKNEVPGIAASTRLQYAQPLFSLGEKSIFNRGTYVDSDYVSIFKPVFIEGNAASAFSQVNSIVLTENMAEQFFGKDRNVVGKALKVNNKEEYVISGVVKNVPENATLQYQWLAPIQLILKESPWLEQWGNNSTSTYIELTPDANLAAVNTQLYSFLQKRDPEQTTRVITLAMADWRLRENFENGKQVGGRIQYVRMFSLIAWIVLLIACVNFMNLATARSEKRMREVGVRKVLGAERRGIIVQFLSEALMVSLIAVAVGVLIISLALPGFNILVEKHLVLNILKLNHIGAAVLIALLCGIVAGSYPALYLSSFNPVHVFKGLKVKNSSASLIRKGLVVLQFTISIILIIGTIVIYQQIQHVKNRDIGYDRNNLITIPVRGSIQEHYKVIRGEMMSTGLVENAGLSNYNTIYMGNNTSAATWKGKDPGSDILVSNRYIDEDLIPTLKLKIKEGRNFHESGIGDSASVVITESLEKLMGSGSAIGKLITFPPRNEGDSPFDYTVVGVVKDFIYGDMYKSSDPVMFYYGTDFSRFIYVRAKENVPTEQVLTKLESIIKANNPAYPFEYGFVDDQFNDRFKSEMLIGKLSRVFAILAIIISCLGLFGLSAYTAERRTREIGIRKILGASIPGIAKMLSKEFLLLVFISAIIAYPLAWLAMQSWLQEYAYRIQINWLVFIFSTALALGIAVITISFQAIRAALANPVKSLRTE